MFPSREESEQVGPQRRAETRFQTIKGVVPVQLSLFCLRGRATMLVHLDKVAVVILAPEVTHGNNYVSTLWIPPSVSVPCFQFSM